MTDDSARREAFVKLSEMEWIVNWTSIQDRLEEDADFVIDPGKMKQKSDTTGLTGIDAVEYKYIAVHLYVIKQKLFEEWKFDRCLYESNDDSSKPVETTSLMVKERSNEKEAKNLQEIQVRWDKSQALVVERGVQYSNVTMARAMQQKQIDTGKFIIRNSPSFLAMHRTFYELRKNATGDQNALTAGSISDVSYCQTSSAYVEAIAMHGLLMHEFDIILMKAEVKHGLDKNLPKGAVELIRNNIDDDGRLDWNKPSGKNSSTGHIDGNGKKDSDSKVNQLKQQLRSAEIKNAGLTDRIEEITGS